MADRELLEQTVNGAVATLSFFDPVAYTRAQTLRDDMRVVAKRWFDAQQAWELELAAMLCQIGRMIIPASVLEKSRKGSTLSRVENEMLTRIPETGANLLARIPKLEGVAQIVRVPKQEL